MPASQPPSRRHGLQQSTWLAVFALALAGCTSTGQAPESFSFEEMMGPFRTQQTINTKRPLGDKDNPVRVLMPDGERAYLHRLRCTNGEAPKFERAGSTGLGPYGKILDLYRVQCPTTRVEAEVYMDMYHCVEEQRPVPGFEIVPEVIQRDKEGCQ